MKYRIYYNNSQDPQHWSIDEGTPVTEICVQGVETNLPVKFCYAANQVPAAWVLVDGILSIEYGCAIFRSERDAQLSSSLVSNMQGYDRA